MELSDIIWQTQTKLFAKDKTSINFSKKQMDPTYFDSFIFLPSLSHEKVGQRRSCISELWDLCDT